MEPHRDRGAHDAAIGKGERDVAIGTRAAPACACSSNLGANAPAVATTRPDRKKGKGRAEPVAPPAPAKPVGPPPKHYSQDDGARVYVGEAGVDVIVPKTPKLHRKSRVEVISTRTRKHHFTIQFADHCTLSFHRPDGETRHVYDLDHPTDCPTQGTVSVEVDAKRR